MGRQSASKKKDTSKAWAAKGTKASAAPSKSTKAGSTDAQKPRPKPKPAYEAAAAAGDDVNDHNGLTEISSSHKTQFLPAKECL